MEKILSEDKTEKLKLVYNDDTFGIVDVYGMNTKVIILNKREISKLIEAVLPILKGGEVC